MALQFLTCFACRDIGAHGAGMPGGEFYNHSGFTGDCLLSVDTATKKYGAASLKVSRAAGGTIYDYLLDYCESSHSDGALGYWLYVPSDEDFPTSDLVVLFGYETAGYSALGSDKKLRIVDASAAVKATMSGVLTAATWYWVVLRVNYRKSGVNGADFWLRLYDSTGALVEEISAVGIGGSLVSAFIGCRLVVAANLYFTYYLDGGYGVSDGWPPICPDFVGGMVPTGAGNYAQWGMYPDSGEDPYEDVDEVPDDGDSTYLHEIVSGQWFSFAHGASGLTDENILAVGLRAMAKGNMPNYTRAYPMMRLSDTDLLGSRYEDGDASYRAQACLLTTTKPGGGPWTVGDVDDVEIGVRSIAVLGYEIRVSSIVLFAAHGPKAPLEPASASLVGDGAVTVTAEVISAGVTHEGEATLSGNGTFSALGAVVHRAAAALAGAGVLAVAAVVALVGAASVSGEGTLTATAKCYAPGAIPISASGTLTAAATGIFVGSAALSGEGVLTAAAVTELTGAAPLTGESTLTVAAQLFKKGVAAIAGEGALSVAGICTRAGAASIVGEGTLSVASALTLIGASSLGGEGTLTASAFVIRGTVVPLSGEGVLSTVAVKEAVGVTLLAGDGTLTADAQCFAPGAIPLSGTGTLTVAACVTRAGAATLAGEGALTATVSTYMEGEASLGATGTLAVTAKCYTPGAAALFASGTLTAAATCTYVGSAPLAGEGAATIDASPILVGVVTLAGEGALHATSVGLKMGVASIAGEGGLTVAAFVARAGVAPLSGSGALTVAAEIIAYAAASLSGAGTLAVSASPILVGTATLAGNGTLTVTAQCYAPGAIPMSATGTLGATAYVTLAGIVSLSGDGALTVAAFRMVAGVASLSGEGTLTVSVLIYCYASATLAGEGTLTTVALCYVSGAVTVSGAGTLGVVAHPILVGIASLSGEGTLQVECVGIRYGIAVLSGEGTFRVLGWIIAAAVVPVAYAEVDVPAPAMAVGEERVTAAAEAEAVPTAQAGSLSPAVPVSTLRLSLPINRGIGATCYDVSIYGNEGTITKADWVDKGDYWALWWNPEEGGQNINCGRHSSLNDLAQLTWEFWGYMEEQQDGGHHRVAIRKANNDFDDSKFLKVEGDNHYQGRVPAATTPAWSWHDLSTDGLFDAWHHFAMTYNNAGDRKIRLYFDGQEVSPYWKQDAAVGTVDPDSARDLIIGMLIAGWNWWGYIAQVRIHSRVLSAEEIQARYEEGFPGTPIVRKAPLPAHARGEPPPLGFASVPPL